MTSSGPSVVVTASRWASFSSARYWSGASVDTPSMLSAQAEPPAQGEPAHQDEDGFGDAVPDALLIRCGCERRQRNPGSRGDEQEARAPRQRDRQVVEHVPRLAWNGRLDDRRAPNEDGAGG